ncbi:tripartite tricarboxylate transporter permease [uncultured Mailhella sp.]|uniref:tripartite tricarboxylate transporter permease n=1 Tax=uncultured Mailhella sp. TaxID=1981031 RepID=UPI0025E02D4D|nr:tripartite tricarboxylate transporter permease [uncultured Mailhella sp.]
MLENLLSGLGLCLTPSVLFWTTFGAVLGLVLGIIPGLGSLIGMALCLPFVFKMDPMEAMPFLAALSATGFTGGSITAVLLGVPGEAANIVTTFDGYPMTQKGQGARAIGAALTSSLVGGVIAVFMAMGMMFIIMPLVMLVTSKEMVFIILAGLSFICLLGKGEKIKSLISGCLGILLSCVGLVSVSGEIRFTFDNPFLFDGFSIIPVTLGLFAVPPLIALAMKGGSGTISNSKAKVSIRDTFEGVKDVLRYKWLCLKCSVIGYFFGVMPGVGAQAAVFVAYGHAKSSAANPDDFGTGDVQGVIAPESCNNAKESGSWLTTLALGIPGSATGAVGLGALVLLGIMPGPSMFTDHLDLTICVFGTLATANVIGFICCLPVVSYLARISLIPGRILVPLVLVIIVLGAYATRGLMADVYILLFFSCLGLLLNRFNFNTGSMLLGFILGDLFETYLFISLQANGWTFFMNPGPIVILICTMIFLVAPFVSKKIRQKRAA